MNWKLLLGAVAVGFFFMSKNTNNEEVNNTNYDELFKKYAAKYGLDWKLLKRISWIESRIGEDKRVKAGIRNPADIESSKSRDGKSWGLMQTTIPTARDYDPTATAQKLNNPEFSISMGAAHINFLVKKYFKNERDIVMAYNQGQGNQLKFISLEKIGTLKPTEFPAAREYWEHYKLAKNLFP